MVTRGATDTVTNGDRSCPAAALARTLVPDCGRKLAVNDPSSAAVVVASSFSVWLPIGRWRSPPVSWDRGDSSERRGLPEDDLLGRCLQHELAGCTMTRPVRRFVPVWT